MRMKGRCQNADNSVREYHGLYTIVNSAHTIASKNQFLRSQILSLSASPKSSTEERIRDDFLYVYASTESEVAYSSL